MCRGLAIPRGVNWCEWVGVCKIPSRFLDNHMLSCPHVMGFVA